MKSLRGEGEVKSCLVIGQGGGADAHGAYALSCALVHHGLCADDVMYYATVKGKEFDKEALKAKAEYDDIWRQDKQRGKEHSYIAGEVFEVAENTTRTLQDFLEDKNGRPAWVGTTWYEQALPHKRTATGATCPLICNLAVPKGSDPHMRAMCKKQHDALGADLAAAAPGGVWDVIIGLDHGGDVFVGNEEGMDGRDVLTGEIIRALVAGGKARRYMLTVHGLCIDGENFFAGMSRKLATVSRIEGCYAGCYGLGEMRAWLEPVIGMFSGAKTPRIIMDALDGNLEAAVDAEGRHLVNSADVDADGRLTVGADGDPAPVPDDAVDPLTGAALAGSNTDGGGGWVKCTPRHHKDAGGAPFPAPWIPRAWASTGYVFDGVAMRAFYITATPSRVMTRGRSANDA